MPPSRSNENTRRRLAAFSRSSPILRRAQNGVPPPTMPLVYDEADFREGGCDVFRCGPPNNLKFRGVTTYHVIIPNRCVISTETVTEGATSLAIALNSLEFERSVEGANIKVTVQIISFVGPGMVESYESGNRDALEGLSRHLSGNPDSPPASTS